MQIKLKVAREAQDTLEKRVREAKWTVEREKREVEGQFADDIAVLRKKLATSEHELELLRHLKQKSDREMSSWQAKSNAEVDKWKQKTHVLREQLQQRIAVLHTQQVEQYDDLLAEKEVLLQELEDRVMDLEVERKELANFKAQAEPQLAQLRELAMQRDDLIHMYEEQVSSQEARLQKADEMIVAIEVQAKADWMRGDRAGTENNTVGHIETENTSAEAHNGQLIALQRQTKMQKQIAQVIEDATKREQELRQELRELQSSRDREMERIEARVKEDAAASAVRMETAHSKVVAVLREAHSREIEAAHSKLKEAQEAYRGLQMDAQSHMAAAQALTAERDRLQADLTRRTQKIKQLKKTIEANQTAVMEQQRFRHVLNSQSQQLERAKAEVKQAKLKLKERQSAVKREAEHQRRLLANEATRVQEGSRRLRNQRHEATQAAGSAAENLKKRETVLRERVLALQTAQAQLAERVKVVQASAAHTEQLRSAISIKAQELDALQARVRKEAARVDRMKKAATTAEDAAKAAAERVAESSRIVGEREVKCEEMEKKHQTEKVELQKERVVLEQMRETALLEKRQALVKVKAADRYKASVARSQGALMARAQNNNMERGLALQDHFRGIE